MIFFITTKKLNEKRLKMLNKILERHMRGAHALPHEVSVFIHIYIYMRWVQIISYGTLQKLHIF